MTSRLRLIVSVLVIALLVAGIVKLRSNARGHGVEPANTAALQHEPTPKQIIEPTANSTSHGAPTPPVEHSTATVLETPVPTPTSSASTPKVNEPVASEQSRRIVTISGQIKTGLDGWSSCFSVRFRRSSNADGSSDAWSATHAVDKKGQFEISGVRAGRYDFAVDLGPHEGTVRELDGVVIGPAADASDRVRVDIDVSSTVRTLQVDTVDDDGNALAADGVVYSGPTDGNARGMFALNHGHATILALRKPRKLSVWANGFLPATVTEIVGDVKVRLHPSLTRIVVQLPMAAAECPLVEKLRVRLRDGTHRPTSAAAVDRDLGCQNSGAPEGAARTPGDGSAFNYRGLPEVPFDAEGKAIITVCEPGAYMLQLDFWPTPNGNSYLDRVAESITARNGGELIVTIHDIDCDLLKSFAKKMGVPQDK